MCLVEVTPHKAAYLTLPQSGGQLSVKEVVQDTVLTDHLQKALQLGVVEDLLRGRFLLGQGDALGGVSGNEVFPHRRIHDLVEYPVDAADRRARQLVSVLWLEFLPPVFL